MTNTTPETTVQARRNPLFVPATNERALSKANTLPADVIIIDCEDSVSPDHKNSARHAAANATTQLANHSVVVRINSLGTPWFEDDIRAISQNPPEAVCVPKVESASETKTIIDTLTQHAGQPVGLWAMIETPAGVLAAADIAATPGVDCLVFGANDLAKDLRIQPVPDRANLHHAMSTIVTAARAAGIQALDAVYNNINDTPGFAAEANQAAAWGFDGKTVIHPRQLEPARAAFTPTPEQINEAQEIVDTWDQTPNQEQSVISVNGRMIEALHVESARRLVALAELYASLDNR